MNNYYNFDDKLYIMIFYTNFQLLYSTREIIHSSIVSKMPTVSKLTGEPFNSRLIPVLTCILSYFHAKLEVVPMILASLPLLIQYTDNFFVSCSSRGIDLNPG